MPLLLPFYFINQAIFGFILFIIIIRDIYSKYILPRFVCLLSTNVFTYIVRNLPLIIFVLNYLFIIGLSVIVYFDLDLFISSSSLLDNYQVFTEPSDGISSGNPSGEPSNSGGTSGGNASGEPSNSGSTTSGNPSGEPSNSGGTGGGQGGNTPPDYKYVMVDPSSQADESDNESSSESDIDYDPMVYKEVKMKYDDCDIKKEELIYKITRLDVNSPLRATMVEEYNEVCRYQQDMSNEMSRLLSRMETNK